MESETKALIKSKMEYVTLGKSGLKVSRFAYGNWITGHGDPEENQNTANALVKLAWEAGINFFDTAEGYGRGQAEVQFGNAIRALGVPRTDYVLSTKLFFGEHTDGWDFGHPLNSHNVNCANRKHLIEGMNRSLKNLGLEYVDVVFIHRYDDLTPTEEVCHAMKAILNSGKAFYWATSEWPAIRIMEAIHICDKIGAPRPIAEQCIYNMFKRHKIEQEYPVLFDDYGLGTTTWSPLHYGILTGKYRKGIPEDSRLGLNKDHSFFAQAIDEFLSETTLPITNAKLEKLDEIAKKLGGNLAQIALAWIISTKDVSTCILGASKVSQLEDNLGAVILKEKLTPEILAEIEGILGTAPAPEFNYREMAMHVPRR